LFFNCGSFALDALWCLDLDAVTSFPGWTAAIAITETCTAPIAIQKPHASRRAGAER